MTKIPKVSAEMLSFALERAREALHGDDAVERVAKYYEIDSNFAGSLFLGIPDPDPAVITVADLFAASSLSIDIPARAARRLLLEPDGAKDVTDALQALPSKPLTETDDKDLRLMETFYDGVKNSLTRAGTTKPSDAWVTASKIAARKRPDLFPVRDTLVTIYLGTRTTKDYFTDWIVFRHLMNDAGVQDELERISNALNDLPEPEAYLVEESRLRLLDVALWTHVSM